MVWILEVLSENGCGKWHFFYLKQGQDLENREAHQEFPGVLARGKRKTVRFNGGSSYQGRLNMQFAMPKIETLLLQCCAWRKFHVIR